MISVPRPLLYLLLLGALLSLFLLWGFDPLPVVDLPQHAAQIALLFTIDDPGFPFHGQYQLNYFTPYLLAYLLAAAFALVLPIPLALKATLTLIGGLWLWALWRFLRCFGTHPSWVLLAFPLFFGLSFLWGFLNYLLAVPLVLLLLESAYGLGRRVEVAAAGDRELRQIGVRLALLGILTFFAHGMACLFALAIAGLVYLVLAGSWRAVLRGIWAFVPPALVAITWTLMSAEVGGKIRFLGLADRLGIHRRLLGDHLDVEAAAWSLALLLLGAVTLFTQRQHLVALPRREAWARRLPLLCTLIYLAAMPEYLAPLAFAGSRFIVFVPIFAAGWLGSELPSLQRRLLPVLTLGWLLVLLVRFDDHRREMRSLEPVFEALPENGRLLSLRIGESRNAFRIPLALHQPVWYTIRKGGQVDFSFAFFRTELVRYRADRQPQIPEGMAHAPWMFDVPKLVGDYYDYWLIFAPPEAEFQGLPENGFELRVNSGPWWLYETRKTP